jgi:hypothetical protein
VRVSQCSQNAIAPSGAPLIAGGATGSFQTEISLHDTSVLNTVIQPFLPRGVLICQVTISANSDLGFPDHFSLSILDKTNARLPTTAPNGTNLLAATDIDSLVPQLQVFGAEGSSAPVAGGPPIILAISSGQPISIAIKPGDTLPSINPSSNGQTPVAILSNPQFSASSALLVSSARFGRTGNETAPQRCVADDVNHDGIPDLVCHFLTNATGLRLGDAAGVLTATTSDGTKVLGFAQVRIVP